MSDCVSVRNFNHWMISDDRRLAGGHYDNESWFHEIVKNAKSLRSRISQSINIVHYQSYKF